MIGRILQIIVYLVVSAFGLIGMLGGIIAEVMWLFIRGEWFRGADGRIWRSIPRKPEEPPRWTAARIAPRPLSARRQNSKPL